MAEVGAGGDAVTPTLLGRWQTRLYVLATWGVFISLLFWLAFRGGPFFAVLIYVLLFGWLFDIGYILLQKLRWDRDWPAVFQFLAGVFEGVVIYGFISTTGLPGIAAGSVSLGVFVAHYGLVWLVTFLWVQGPMRVWFPWWRFRGGRLM